MTRLQTSALLLCSSAAWLCTITSAFVASQLPPPQVSKTRLSYYFMDPSSDNNSSSDHVPMELQELEAKRLQFENLMAECMPESGILNDKLQLQKQQPHLLLTTSGRRFRELEMDLLGSLMEGDDGIEQLIHLWTTERDEKASADLLAMQETCSEGLVVEEIKLKQLCHEYPGWAEPYSRLATLMYYKGQFEQAVSFVETATNIKPWHFEALQMAVLLAQQTEKVPPIRLRRVKRLAKFAMPKLDADTTARKIWVARALVQATKQLQEAEERTAELKRTQYRGVVPPTEDEIWQ